MLGSLVLFLRRQLLLSYAYACMEDCWVQVLLRRKKDLDKNTLGNEALGWDRGWEARMLQHSGELCSRTPESGI